MSLIQRGCPSATRRGERLSGAGRGRPGRVGRYLTRWRGAPRTALVASLSALISNSARPTMPSDRAEAAKNRPQRMRAPAGCCHNFSALSALHCAQATQASCTHQITQQPPRSRGVFQIPRKKAAKVLQAA